MDLSLMRDAVWDHVKSYGIGRLFEGRSGIRRQAVCQGAGWLDDSESAHR